jgi:hyperosmotically inducible protein
MRIFRLLPLAGLLAAALVLPGCSSSGTKTSAESKLTDSDLERAVKTRLSTDPDLMKLDVSANADRNEVTLSGTVPTEELRLRAVDLAKSSAGALVVTDKIDVQPREYARSEYTEDMARKAKEQAKSAGDKIGDSLDDAWIHTKITAKLLANSSTPARKINVDVMNNVVTLRGTVGTETERVEAARVAKDTDGVKRVVNNLKVQAGV